MHHDHLNSVTALSDHNGQAWRTYQYHPFGNPLSTASPQVPNDFTYTGREWDAVSGLYYYRARYYDPEVGRFISEDPLGFEAGVKFYAYVANQALIANDPLGLRVYYAEAGGMAAAKLLGKFLDIEPGATISSILAVETNDSYNPFSWEMGFYSNYEASLGAVGYSSRASLELFVGVGVGSGSATLEDLEGASTTANVDLNAGRVGVLATQIRSDGKDSYFTSLALTRELGEVGSYSVSASASRAYGLSLTDGEGFSAIDTRKWLNPSPIFERFSSAYPSINSIQQYFQPAMCPKP